jgi:hypothetical protein
MIETVLDKTTNTEYKYSTEDTIEDLPSILTLTQAIEKLVHSGKTASISTISRNNRYTISGSNVIPETPRTIVIAKESFGDPETYWKDVSERYAVESEVTNRAFAARKAGIASAIGEVFYIESSEYSVEDLRKIIRIIENN